MSYFQNNVFVRLILVRLDGIWTLFNLNTLKITLSYSLDLLSKQL